MTNLKPLAPAIAILGLALMALFAGLRSSAQINLLDISRMTEVRR